MRPAVPRARRALTLRSAITACASHSTGPSPANTSAEPFTLPTVNTTRANSAGCRQPPRRAPRIVSAISHGSAAHGSSSAEMRAE